MQRAKSSSYTTAIAHIETSTTIMIQALTQSLGDETQTKNSLDEAGTLFREESWRSHPQASDFVRHVLPIVYTNNATALSALRVLINFTADNDANRRYLAGDSDEVVQFHGLSNEVLFNCHQSLELFPVASRVALFLTQFIRNVSDDDRGEFLGFLKLYIPGLFLFLSACATENALDDAANAMEILNEFPVKTLTGAIEDPTMASNTTMALLEALITHQDPEDPECLLQTSHLLSTLTSADLVTHVDAHDLLAKLKEIANETENLAKIKRYLFAAAGNLLTAPDHSSWLTFDKSMAMMLDPSTEPYAVAAVAIDVGNCVRSQQDQQALLVRIEAVAGMQQVVSGLLRRQFSDVVQYQFFHFCNNTINEVNASLYIQEENYPHLLGLSKVLVDNGKFYQEIFNIYRKFAVKLVRYAFKDRSVVPYADLWRLLMDSETSIGEIAPLLLQAEAARKSDMSENSEFFTRIVHRTTALEEPTEAKVLLEKLKALAIVLQNHDYVSLEAALGIESARTFLTKLAALLREVSQGLGDDSNTGEASVVKNNLIFVAASARKFFDDDSEASISAKNVMAETFQK